jgi:hypothetical protein
MNLANSFAVHKFADSFAAQWPLGVVGLLHNLAPHRVIWRLVDYVSELMLQEARPEKSPMRCPPFADSGSADIRYRPTPTLVMN